MQVFLKLKLNKGSQTSSLYSVEGRGQVTLQCNSKTNIFDNYRAVEMFLSHRLHLHHQARSEKLRLRMSSCYTVKGKIRVDDGGGIPPSNPPGQFLALYTACRDNIFVGVQLSSEMCRERLYAADPGYI